MAGVPLNADGTDHFPRKRERVTDHKIRREGEYYRYVGVLSDPVHLKWREKDSHRVDVAG